MAKLTDSQIVQYLQKSGFSGNALITGVAIVLAESGGNTSARHENTDSTGHVLSVDRGMWQINNVYHAEVSDSCAFDPSCSTTSAFKISSNGASFAPWSTYTSGAYKKFVQRAQLAIGSGPSGPPNPPPGSPAVDYSNLVFQTLSAKDLNTSQISTYGTGDVMAPYKIILALAIIFLFLFVISKTRAGYTAIYWGQLLILLFLFATQFTFFQEALTPLSGLTSPQTS